MSSNLSEKHWVIVGLGNPGRRYANTRHNVGYMIVQALADLENWKFKEEGAFQAEVVKGRIGEEMIHLILPLTYMNLSGQAVRLYLDFFKLRADNLIVVHDDIAIPFEQFQLRLEGGAGGHNGIKSIAASLQTQNFLRLRVGIGNERGDQLLADYVLDSFRTEERQKLPSVIENGVHILRRMIKQ